jgi:PadR family transcriptional regulator, regulatory protein PadR
MNDKLDTQTHVDKLSAEMRRGLIVLVVMSQLNEPEYAYSLLKKLEEKGFEISQDALYPLMRKLDEQGYLNSDWKVDESRPRRYYQLSSLGEAVYTALKTEWKEQFEQVIQIIYQENEK